MGLVREEQRGALSVERNVLGLHDVTVGVLVGILHCGFVECHGQSRGRALKSVIILEGVEFHKDTVPRTQREPP